MAAAAGMLLLLFAIAAGALLRARTAELPARPAADRPELLLLTSLPIMFPETLTLQTGASPALEALQQRYQVVPISLADPKSLGSHRLLLMAQPQAQPGEVLVGLDQWVRGGGRVLLLADPALEWPSGKALGDPTRPPFAFPDTGLLGHWGLRLDAPDALGPASERIGGRKLSTAAPGELVATGGQCAVEARLVARCRIGKGRATVIADADLLDSRRFGRGNLGLVVAELDSLER